MLHSPEKRADRRGQTHTQQYRRCFCSRACRASTESSVRKTASAAGSAFAPNSSVRDHGPANPSSSARNPGFVKYAASYSGFLTTTSLGMPQAIQYAMNDAGYANLMQRLHRSGPAEIVYAPDFRRES